MSRSVGNSCLLGYARTFRDNHLGLTSTHVEKYTGSYAYFFLQTKKSILLYVQKYYNVLKYLGAPLGTTFTPSIYWAAKYTKKFSWYSPPGTCYQQLIPMYPYLKQTLTTTYIVFPQQKSSHHSYFTSVNYLTTKPLCHQKRHKVDNTEDEGD